MKKKYCFFCDEYLPAEHDREACGEEYLRKVQPKNPKLYVSGWYSSSPSSRNVYHITGVFGREREDIYGRGAWSVNTQCSRDPSAQTFYDEPPEGFAFCLACSRNIDREIAKH